MPNCKTIIALPTLKQHLNRTLLLELGNKLLNSVNSGSRTSRLGNKNLALLINNKYTTLGALGRLLQANGLNEGRLGVTKKRVRELLLLLECGVCLGRVGAEAIDGKTISSERLVRVSEEADLGGAYFPIKLASLTVERLEWRL